MTRLAGSPGTEPEGPRPLPPPPSSWPPGDTAMTATPATPTPATGGTLADVVRSAAAPPSVVVLDVAHDITNTPWKGPLKLDEDLWLSTADGRFNSPIIPVYVGEEGSAMMQTFYVHKNLLLRVGPFEKALCGDFKEAKTQEIRLPEEDPATFHFLVAFLYEGTFRPIKPAAAALDPKIDKGKGKETAVSDTEESELSFAGNTSDSSAQARIRTRVRRYQRRYREERDRVGVFHAKHPGRHRPDCACPACEAAQPQACGRCGLRPQRPPPPPARPPPGRRGMVPPPMNAPVVVDVHHHHHALPPGGGGGPGLPGARPRPPPPGAMQAQAPPMMQQQQQHPPPIPGLPAAFPIPQGPPGPPPMIAGEEDMRTWLLTYRLTLDVYMLAHRFLMYDFKAAAARHAIDMLESAGTDAAHPEMLQLCMSLHEHVGEGDRLLRMVLARAGFLQPWLWRRYPGETSEFLVAHPELAAAMLRETAVRRESEVGWFNLPSLERVADEVDGRNWR